MKEFMDRNFLLETETARHLFHDYAAAMPIIDYHCHIPPREIYENRRFDDLVQVWLGGENPDGTYFGDHYKWRLMRSNGISEDYVTGRQPAFERFVKFAETLELAIGNPMYHWCNLELRQFFGVQKALTPETAREAWDTCNEKLRNDPDLTVRGIIERANVAMIGTTDDPTDTLEWHEKIAADPSIQFKVCPSFRPDKAINISKPGFAQYIAQLSASVGKKLSNVQEVCDALVERLEFFKKLGCRASDHGLDYVPFQPYTMEQADAVYQKVMQGQRITQQETEGYQTVILLHLGRAYHRMGIVMQIHYNCLRNPNTNMFRKMGADSGYDLMNNWNCAQELVCFLDALNQTDELPRTILYSLNSNENEFLDTVLGAFQGSEVPGKLQHGAAWWFNDTRSGMEAQMKSLANLSLLGNFVGMLTDSRSFLSYARHDYFRRILCNLLGSWVENGEYPNDDQALKKIVEGICYHNAARYFEL